MTDTPQPDDHRSPPAVPARPEWFCGCCGAAFVDDAAAERCHDRDLEERRGEAAHRAVRAAQRRTAIEQALHDAADGYVAELRRRSPDRPGSP